MADPVALRLRFVIDEPYPTHRPDVAVLFGRLLPRLGVASDLVSRADALDVPPWPAGALLLAHTGPGRLRSHWAVLVNDLRSLVTWRTAGQPVALQVRDKPLIALIGLAIARSRGVPFFYWMSFPLPAGALARARALGARGGLRALYLWMKGSLGQWALDWVVRGADHVFVQSDAMRAALVSEGVSASRMTAVPMAVDLARLATEPVAPSADPRLTARRVIAYLGTIERLREPQFLLEVLALLVPRHPKVLLVIIGDAAAPERRWFEALAAQRGLAPHLLVTGWLGGREAWSYVRAAEVALSPIPRGPLFDVSSPTKLVEYLALGVPVVATDIPDQREVLERSGAGRAVAFRAEPFADAVDRYLAEPATARSDGRRGPAFIAAERDYAVLAERLAARYRELAGGARP